MNKKKILYAEDDRLSRELVKEPLGLEGFEVLVSFSGKDVRGMFQEEEGIAVVVLDIEMPGGYDGFEVAEHIQGTDTQVPFVFYTSHDERDYFQCACRHGMRAFVVKGGSMEELVVTVKNALRADNTHLHFLADGVTFDDNTFDFCRGGKCKHLSFLEGRVLAILCQNKGRLVTKERLIRAGWGELHWDSGNEQLPKAIGRLRSLLRNTGVELKVVNGKGYWLIDKTGR